MTDPAVADLWHDWLLRERSGADAGYAARMRPRLEALRDGVLDAARLTPGCVLADIGSGDGLVAFGALEREPDLHAIFTDISPALIEYVRGVAARNGFAARSRFLVAAAESLDAIADGAVDVVTARAVFAYLPDRAAAVRECYRVLRPGGRVSIVDPIFADRAFALAGIAHQLALPGVAASPAGRRLGLLHRIGRAQLPDSLEAIRADPLTNYTERDLLRLFENAGFVDLRLRLHIDCVPAPPVPWEVHLRTSLRAGTPAIGEILATQFTAAERAEYERDMRPAVESGGGTDRLVNAFVSGAKPDPGELHR